MAGFTSVSVLHSEQTAICTLLRMVLRLPRLPEGRGKYRVNSLTLVFKNKFSCTTTLVAVHVKVCAYTVGNGAVNFVTVVDTGKSFEFTFAVTVADTCYVISDML